MMQFASSTANAIGVTLFSTLFLTFIIQIIARFAFNHPLAWTDELAVVLYIWMVLWCAAFVVRDREHVMFDLAYNAASPLVQRGMRLVGSLALAGLIGYGLAGNWDYIWFMRRERTPVLDISFLWVFVPFMFLLVSLVVRNVSGVWRALRQAQGERLVNQDERLVNQGERMVNQDGRLVNQDGRMTDLAERSAV
ncbi:MAG: TRAP transporter small permease [Cytophagales bacterium]|nr:TRAP transporter small permease [Cytophagales bacterium]